MISLTSPVKTVAHDWPAGAKLIALCLMTIGLFAAKTLVVQLGAFVVCLTFYALLGKPFFKSGARRLLGLWPFLALISVWHILTGETEEGLVISLRMASAVGFANLVTLTTRLSDMIAVMNRLTAPIRWLGIDTRPLEIAIAMVVRFVPVLTQKGQVLGLAWRARSVKRTGWQIVMPFTVLALDDADHVAEALRTRGGATRPKDT